LREPSRVAIAQGMIWTEAARSLLLSIVLVRRLPAWIAMFLVDEAQTMDAMK
jgi:hypothetical protein